MSPADPPLHGCFVTGTDTGVGKTVVAAAIVAGLRERGVTARALKPLITGLDEPPDPVWPRDHELLAALSATSTEETILAGYGPAVSPHLAAELAGSPPPSIAALAGGIRAAAARAPDALLIVEGVGGLLVPLGPDGDVGDLAHALGLAVIVAARPGLGTINHTLLTLEAARHRDLTIAGVVLTPWPAAPGAMLTSNRATIERLGAVEVATLETVAAPDRRSLAAAARSLPLERWLGVRLG